jgi:hypothetical protein
LYVRSNKRFEVNEIEDYSDCNGLSKKVRVILDVIDVKQNHSKGGKSDLYVYCVDGCAKPTPLSLAPGEGVRKPEGQKAFASKGHLLSGLSVDRFDNNAPLDEPAIHEYKAFEMGFWDCGM